MQCVLVRRADQRRRRAGHFDNKRAIGGRLNGDLLRLHPRVSEGIKLGLRFVELLLGVVPDDFNFTLV